ncbi:hypothetical protein C2845_PM17G11830 [Panicum miliaceum]|uniref:Uncharacterized protein n=1 Tax=Panicum miliaceum TaxID=4540 RepID=A0A3L6Q5V9_PANMI|nr:hypothetical protein C2845_PM17G11830 [Panicum miliaceum]
MAQRSHSRARRDPDLDDDDIGGGSPPSRHPRRGGSGDEEEEDDDVGNEDLSLEIVARARRRRRKRRGASGGGTPGLADLLQVGGTQEGLIGTAESVLTEDGADVPASDNMVLRKLLQIRCYVCNQNGHLCCFDVADNCPKQISCYNCAKSGHSGLFDRSKGKSSSHSQRKEKWKKDSSTRSAPHDARKTSKRKSPHFEDRTDIPRHKSKARGGWTGGDDLDDLPFKKYKSNGWGSPSTPKKPYMNHQISDGDYFTPQSSRRHNHGYMSQNSNYSPSAKKHRFSSSRFAASNTHVRFGRS